MEYLYLVLSRTFGATKGFAVKKAGSIASGEENSAIINLFRSLACTAVSLIIWLVSGAVGSNAVGNALIVVSGVSNVLYLYFWVLSASVLSISLIEVFSMIGMVVLPLVLAPVLYSGDSASLIQWIGVLFIFIAAFLMCDETDTFDKSNIKKTVLYLSATVIGGFGMTVSQKLYSFHVTEHGIGTIEYFNLGTFAIAALLFIAICAIRRLCELCKAKKEGLAPKQSALSAFPIKRVWLYIAVAAIATYGYQYFITLASTLPSAVLFPLSSGLGMVGVFVLDTFFFSVKLTPKRILSFISVAIAIVLVNL